MAKSANEPVGNGCLVAWGASVTILGIAAYRFFSPSPHGYLELFIAIPMIVVGLGAAGLGLAFGTFRTLLRMIGWLLIMLATAPMLLALSVWLMAIW